MQKLSAQMGAKNSSRLTKQEAVTFLRRKLKVPEHFKKIFTKIWGASGKYTLEYSRRQWCLQDDCDIYIYIYIYLSLYLQTLFISQNGLVYNKLRK